MIALHFAVLMLTAIAIISVVAFCVRATLRAKHLHGVLSLEGMNTPELATSNFIKTVGHAEKTLIIHDDGNHMADSVYNDEKAIDAVVRQMQEHDSLRVRCWFNEEDDLGLVTTIRKDDHLANRFDVRYRNPSSLKLWRSRWLDPHYKIADDGEFGTVSRHAFGAQRRRFQIEDCTQASEEGRDITLGAYMRRFDRGFEKGIPSSGDCQ